MKKIRITVKRIARYDDLIAEYENPIEHACAVTEGRGKKSTANTGTVFFDGKFQWHGTRYSVKASRFQCAR